jgi:hypothetical protein
MILTKDKMKYRVVILTSVLLLVFNATLSAQISRVTYFMRIPQNHLLNPAFRPASRFNIGIPVLAGISGGFGNNFFELTDILTPDLKADSIISFQNPNFDLEKLAAKLKDRNTISADASVQLLGIGFPLGKNLYLYADVMDRLTVKTLFPRDLMELYELGSTGFTDRTLDISEMNLKAQYFREYGVGLSGNITGSLRIGGRIKLLSGLASVSLINRSLHLIVNDDLSQGVIADASLQVSGKETIQKILTDNNFILQSPDTSNDKVNVKGFIQQYLGAPVSNTGIGIDLGIVYNFGRLFTLSASIADLGFINWKKDLKSYDANANFTLPGITLQDVVDQSFSIDDMVSSLKDSIVNNFVEDQNPPSFKTYLPTRISVGGSFNILPVLSFGILSDTRIFAGSARETVSFSANTYLGRTFNASVNYTIDNFNYNNLGFGLAFKAGFAQVYLIADKIPLTWERVYFSSGDDKYKAIPIPGKWNMFNFQVGMNIAFGKFITRKTDKPMVILDQQ